MVFVGFVHYYYYFFVSQVDLLPTICAMTGIKPDHQPQGVDISPLLHDPMAAVRDDQPPP